MWWCVQFIYTVYSSYTLCTVHVHCVQCIHAVYVADTDWDDVYNHLLRPCALLQFMEYLEKLLYNAYEGYAVAMPSPPKVQSLYTTCRNQITLTWNIIYCPWLQDLVILYEFDLPWSITLWSVRRFNPSARSWSHTRVTCVGSGFGGVIWL